MTGLGLVAIPDDWELDFSRIRRVTLSTSPEDGDEAVRRQMLADDVCAWFTWIDRMHEDGAEMWVEGYPNGGRVFNLPLLCELGGVIKHEMRLRGWYVQTAPLTKGRALLGTGNGRGAKAAAQHVVKAMDTGCILQTEHERDAFVCAQYGLAEIPAPFVTIGPVQPSRTVRGKVRRQKGRRRVAEADRVR